MAAEHKAAFEKVESKLQSLQEEYAGLDEELQEKQDEIESYRSKIQTGNSSDHSSTEQREPLIEPRGTKGCVQPTVYFGETKRGLGSARPKGRAVFTRLYQRAVARLTERL